MPEVPKFYHTALLKPKDVDNDRAEVIRLLPHMGMDDHEFTFGNHPLHLQDFVWVLERVFLHPRPKGLRRSFEERVVVPEPSTDELRVGLVNLYEDTYLKPQPQAFKKRLGLGQPLGGDDI